MFVGLLILLNFLFACYTKSKLPDEGSDEAAGYNQIDSLFTYIFTFELLCNMYAHFFWE